MSDSNKKWHLLPNPIADDYFVIEALRDFADVKKGDKGGAIMVKPPEFNSRFPADPEQVLSHEGDCWIYSGVAYADVRIEGNATVRGASIVRHGVLLKDNAVLLDSDVSCNITVAGNSRLEETFLSNNSKEENFVIDTDETIKGVKNPESKLEMEMKRIYGN